ncbi:MAG: type II CAAX endopeptidase family protein [Dehalococcoidia bacterium]|nr:type II CAAX endopeptidase family protein [Dehalococcoidia bacterium]
MTDQTRVWPVFLVYAGAFAAVVVLSLIAALVLRALYPDVPADAVFDGLPGLLAGGMASSTGLVLTVLIAARPLDPAHLRLIPGRETGGALGIMIIGMLALGQALDSLTMLVGLGNVGSMPAIRRALTGAAGPDLGSAVLVIGVMAATAEEVFFRAYMQSRLRARWGTTLTVVATSACFGLMHLEWLHAVLAFFLGLYLGFLTERSGSALPAIACHVVNNVIFTLLTAFVGTVEDFWPNVILFSAGALVFGASLAWLSRALPRP